MRFDIRIKNLPKDHLRCKIIAKINANRSRNLIASKRGEQQSSLKKFSDLGGYDR